MEKYLVISYYESAIEVDAVKDTYEEARQFMEDDVRDFVAPEKLEDLMDDECILENYSAFANIGGDAMCTWTIKKVIF